jgi:transcriptional regulator with XRE-family HTH domain
MDEKKIAGNIRRVRLKGGTSLERLAQSSGLTKGYLSKIENSDKAPPFSTLAKIAQALGVDLTLLISAEDDVPTDTRLCIVRADERKKTTGKNAVNRYLYDSLAYKKTGKNMEPYLITPAFDEKTTFSHEGEEFMYVLDGTHEFIYGGETYILRKGDSIYFDSSVPHSGKSVGRKRARVLAVMYSYKRL